MGDRLLGDSELPRSVIPRKDTDLPTYQIIALSNGTYFSEYGQRGTEEFLIEKLDSLSSSIFVSRNAAGFLARCHNRHRTNSRWNYQAKATKRETFHPGKERPPVRVSVVINWFGFKHTKELPSLRHLTFDPVTFYGRSLDEIYPETVCSHSGDCDCNLKRLLQWGLDLKSYCNENSLLPKPTTGSLACQFLRDKRFYPENRRKVPAFINENARGALPGNHYRLYAIEGGQCEYSAIYIDQKRSHHYHAEHTRLPNANALYARGRYDSIGSGRNFAVSDTFSGLYYLHYSVPDPSPQFSIFPDQKPGEYHGFVWSNELQWLRDNGYVIHGATASWGAFTYDTGIKTYSRWAQQELDRLGDPKWLKPILLSTYGVLAIRPRAVEYLYGNTTQLVAESQIHTGQNLLSGYLIGTRNGQKLEPGFANVLHRGMIEASCRIETVGFAQYLADILNFNVLSLYADAVIIEKPDRYSHILTHNKFPNPWRVQAELNHLRFLNKQAFISGQMTKLPGIVNRDILKVTFGTAGRAPKRKPTMTMAVSGEKFIDRNAESRYLNA